MGHLQECEHCIPFHLSLHGFYFLLDSEMMIYVWYQKKSYLREFYIAKGIIRIGDSGSTC